jgi:GNAT superfamily N-acetyltransferase
MSEKDIQDAMRLKEAAHWNQVPEDWIGFMRLEPLGCFVGELDGQVVSTATNFSFENRFGWIGMILVDPVQRRKGIATRMMERSIAYLESLPCPCQRLDATDAGAKVYERIGFLTEYQVERWTHDGISYETRAEAGVSELTVKNIDRIARWDADIFGASRKSLLHWYVENSAPSLLAGEPENPKGFLVGRPGSGAFQLGPMSASSVEVASDLIHSFLTLLPTQPMIADMTVANPDSKSLLEELGFQPSRVLQRMYRGPNQYPGDPSRAFLLAGFEFG